MKIVKFTDSLITKTLHEIKNTDKLKGIQWRRFQKLNDILKGFRGGELTILSGRSGVGKSTFLSEYCLDLCEQQVPTLIGSFEMSLTKVIKLLLYQFSRLPLHQESDIANQAWAKKFECLPIYYIDKQGVVEKPSDIVKLMEDAVTDYKVQHIALDNIQFLLGSDGDTFQAQFLRQDRFIQAVRQFTNETKCHCTVVSHPRKEDIGRLLSINSLYGGGKMTQEADNVLLLQDESTLPDVTYPKRYIQIVKNRYDGQLGRMDLRFHRHSKTFSGPELALDQRQGPTSFINFSALDLSDDKFG